MLAWIAAFSAGEPPRIASMVARATPKFLVRRHGPEWPRRSRNSGHSCFVVHGAGGWTKFPGRRTARRGITSRGIKRYVVTPEDFPGWTLTIEANPRAGSLRRMPQSCGVLRMTGPRRDSVVINSAAALVGRVSRKFQWRALNWPRKRSPPAPRREKLAELKKISRITSAE